MVTMATSRQWDFLSNHITGVNHQLVPKSAEICFGETITPLFMFSEIFKAHGIEAFGNLKSLYIQRKPVYRPSSVRCVEE